MPPVRQRGQQCPDLGSVLTSGKCPLWLASQTMLQCSLEHLCEAAVCTLHAAPPYVSAMGTQLYAPVPWGSEAQASFGFAPSLIVSAWGVWAGRDLVGS